MHSLKGELIHRDLKPSNILVDHDEKVIIIDFGISKKYLNNNGEHYAFNKTSKFCGTVRYASIAAHKGYSQSRKDDLESIIYVKRTHPSGMLEFSSRGVRSSLVSCTAPLRHIRFRLVGLQPEASIRLGTTTA